MKTKYILLFGLIILTFSCNYRWKTIADKNGKKHWFREYKNYEDQEIYKEQQVFKKRYKPQTYKKYNGTISLITVDSFPYVQFDTVRIGFGKEARQFIDIFTIGLLNSQIIYCYQDSLCRPPIPMTIINANTGELITPHIGYWYGNIINVGYIEEPNHLKISPQKRRFKLWINTIHGANGYHIFFIELSNNKVDKYVDIKDFVKNATLTFMISPWFII